MVSTKFFIQLVRNFLLLILCVNFTSAAEAGGYLLRVGPPGTARGGPNPISFSPLDFELGYVTQKGYQTTVSVTGILVGLRHTSSWGGYVALGGGLVLSAAGAGPGVFTEFGGDFRCGWFCWSAAYTQAIGITSEARITNPYAFRFGISAWFK